MRFCGNMVQSLNHQSSFKRRPNSKQKREIAPPPPVTDFETSRTPDRETSRPPTATARVRPLLTTTFQTRQLSPSLSHHILVFVGERLFKLHLWNLMYFVFSLSLSQSHSPAPCPPSCPSRSPSAASAVSNARGQRLARSAASTARVSRECGQQRAQSPPSPPLPVAPMTQAVPAPWLPT